ncbi:MULTISPECIES: hypothetical protein [unclassified Streptomyces]|uniref:hypothetical protein n=1 Tax=unclassified Streptomyces TaxID=2593676 RepID=UPI00203450CB|nr:hypothetical protein [Streptomyces sp. RKAG290]MCM2411523.1 hypothetical protein [Streptomyces sp. RKAG290]
MYELELHKIMQAELIRRADNERLIREVRRNRRANRGSARKEAERTVSADRDRERFAHAA